MMPLIDLTGQKFGQLTILNRAPSKRTKFNTTVTYWYCKCSCGEITKACTVDLRRGRVKSCGCLKHRVGEECPNFKFGCYSSKYKSTYCTWGSMKNRCLDKNNKNYGGRGIKVCKRWLKFENFLEDMGIKPKGKSLERINNAGDYKPSNCKWGTKKEQANNRRRYQAIENFSNTELKNEINRRGWNLC